MARNPQDHPRITKSFNEVADPEKRAAARAASERSDTSQAAGLAKGPSIVDNRDELSKTVLPGSRTTAEEAAKRRGADLHKKATEPTKDKDGPSL